MIVLIFGTLFFFIIKHKKSFKHPAIIAVQVGENYNDVVIVNDVFRVRRTQDGYYVTEFKTLTNERTPTPDFNVWNIFGDTNVTDKNQKNEKKKWSEKEIKGFISRGVIFYKSAQGDLKPCIFGSEGKLKILSQDNKAFLMNEVKRRQELFSSKKDMWMKLGIFGMALLFSSLIFIFTLVYLNTTLSDTIGTVCSGAAQSAQYAFASNITAVIGG
jgi:hypothetical protein